MQNNGMLLHWTCCSC